MSSPTPNAAPEEAPKDNELDADVDAEMTDSQVPAAPTTNGPSSNVEPDYTQQQETQATSNASHHNRKDATLREFLSKMDDYAPIVWFSTSAWVEIALTCS